MLHTNVPFVWDNHAQYSFDVLNQALTSAPLLSPLDFTKYFILYVSASKNSNPGVLVQEDSARQEHAIYYVSQKVSGPPLCYPHEENMALAIIFSIQKLCHYILLSHTRVMADSNSMKYLLSRRLVQVHVAKWIVIL